MSSKKHQKLIFVSLLGTSCLILLVTAYFVWWVPYVGLSRIYHGLPLIYGILLGIFVASVICITVLLILSLVLEREILFSYKLKGFVLKVGFPLILFLGRMVGIPKQKLQQSFIEINNKFVLSRHHKVTPERLLLLMPHCLQNNECKVKITGNAENCQRCGICEIKELVELAHKKNVKLSVATGGTIARRIVVENKPEIIIASACERDLTSGIQDSYPIPVYGILNERPQGPCRNTLVDMTEIKGVMGLFLDGEESPNPG